MNKVLTVTGVNFKPVDTAYTKTFDTTKMSDVQANGQSSNIPAVTGNAEFMYEDTDGVFRHFVVSEALALVLASTTGFTGAAADDCSAEEFDNVVRKTKITIEAFDQTVANANLAFGKKIYDFPEGYIKILACVVDVTLSAATCTATPEVGVGTVLAAGVNATLGAAGATTENILDGTAMSAIDADGTQYLVNGALESDQAAGFDGHTTPVDLYINFAAGWGAADDVTIEGTVEITWMHIGDA